MFKFFNKFTGSWNNTRNKLIYIFGIMIFFFMLFDGIISYLIPLVIFEHGFSKTLVGIIIGTAAISGAFFDFVIYKIFKNSFYRRLFIIMFAVSFIYIFTLWTANSMLLFIAAMVMWGFYFDLKNFGTIDFVSRYSPKKELTTNFGILQIFQSIGYLLAPLIAGFVIIETVGWQPFVIATVFLSIAVFFFVMLEFNAYKKKQYIPIKENSSKKTFFQELIIWKKVGKLILPALFLAFIFAIFDAFFLTIGPMLAETLPLEPFDGLFMFAYFLPPLIISGLIGGITKKFGEKKIVLFGLLIGASILSTMTFFKNPLLIILIVFLSSCFICVITPVIQSIYAKCIHESPKVKKEVQELGDFFGNFGYFLGPIAAGIIADKIGNSAAFSVLGLMGIIFAILLFIFIPKKLAISKIKV